MSRHRRDCAARTITFAGRQNPATVAAGASGEEGRIPMISTSNRYRFSCGLAAGTMLAAGALVSSEAAALEWTDADLYVRIVDVGAALCAIAVIPDGHVMVYDAGHWDGGRCVEAVRELAPAGRHRTPGERRRKPPASAAASRAGGSAPTWCRRPSGLRPER